MGDCLWKGGSVRSNFEGSYHLVGEECHGDDQEAVKVCDHISLCDEEGVEIGSEADAHLTKLKVKSTRYFLLGIISASSCSIIHMAFK